jgi:hypothetical protein
MNEPVSVFDLGMYRLKRYANSEAKSWGSGKVVAVDVEYAWEDNEIRLMMGVGQTANPAKARNVCEKLIHSAREHLAPEQHASIGALRLVFSHVGYRKKNEPVGLYRKLGARVVLMCSALYPGGSITGQGKLLGDTAVHFANTPNPFEQKARQKTGNSQGGKDGPGSTP